MEITYVNQKGFTLIESWSESPTAPAADETTGTDSSGVYICKSVVNYLSHGNFVFKSEVNYLTYEHRIVIPVEFTYVNQ